MPTAMSEPSSFSIRVYISCQYVSVNRSVYLRGSRDLSPYPLFTYCAYVPRDVQKWISALSSGRKRSPVSATWKPGLAAASTL